jgi:hypothetical protein
VSEREGQRPLRRTRLLSVFVAAGAIAACTNSTRFEEATGEIVVGFSTEGLGATAPVERVELRATADGEAREVKVDLPTQRTELLVSGRSFLDVELSGYGGPGKLERLWVRKARAPFVRGQKRLLRLEFDPLCVAPIGQTPTVCAGDQTCARGACVGALANDLELETYRPDWYIAAPDPCRPTATGTPEAQVGMGAAFFQEVPPGTEVALEAGPQGGHHLWIAIRTRNLASRGTFVGLSGGNPETGEAASAASFVLALDQGTAGTCHVAGLRYQVDGGGIDYRRFLGKPFEVSVEMRDRFGATVRGQLVIKIAAAVKT